MRTYVFKLYQDKRNRHLHRKISLAGSIYNHLIALHRRYDRMFGYSVKASMLSVCNGI
jgi:putative transposase